jgi:hypothetical protein
VRCIKRKRNDAEGDVESALEITNVDSVDKVYRIMTEHMKLGVRFYALSLDIVPYDIALISSHSSLSIHIRRSIPKHMNACDATSRVIDIWRKRTHPRLSLCSIKPSTHPMDNHPLSCLQDPFSCNAHVPTA